RVFRQLHMDLFYSFGWPSWAGYKQLEAEDSPPLQSPDADPYLLEPLADSSHRQGEPLVEIEASIHGRGRWEHTDGGSNGVILQTDARELGLTASTNQTGPLFEVRAEQSVLLMVCICPTLDRARQFLGVYQGLSQEMLAAFGWRAARRPGR